MTILSQSNQITDDYIPFNADQSASWCDPTALWDTTPVFDEDTAAAYAEWQESLDYLLHECGNNGVDYWDSDDDPGE